MPALAEESKINRIVNHVSLTYQITLPCVHERQLKLIRNQTNNTFPIIKLVVAIFFFDIECRKLWGSPGIYLEPPKDSLSANFAFQVVLDF